MWVLAIVNVTRAVIDILYDNYAWSNMIIVAMEAVSNSIVFSVEASVVIFVLHAHMENWSQLLKRVAIITIVLFVLYGASQAPLILLNKEYITTWGYYSLYNYWIAVNSVWTVVYIVLLIFKLIGSERIRMPSTWQAF